jgi:hypothetical protein
VNLGNWSPTLIEIITAANDARIDERRGFGWHAGTYPVIVAHVNGESAGQTTSCFAIHIIRPVNPTRTSPVNHGGTT